MTEPTNSPTQQPSIGRIVLVKTHGHLINGQDEHAALITQVWGPECINATVFCGDGALLPLISISIEKKSTVDQEAEGAPLSSVTWRWPPRV